MAVGTDRDQRFGRVQSDKHFLRELERAEGMPSSGVEVEMGDPAISVREHGLAAVRAEVEIIRSLFLQPHFGASAVEFPELQPSVIVNHGDKATVRTKLAAAGARSWTASGQAVLHHF